MLNPFVYSRIVQFIDERVDKHLKPYVYQRPSYYIKAVERWEALNQEQKEYIVELVERIQKETIAKNINKCKNIIPVPRIGLFIFSNAKFYKMHNKEELSKLTKEERKERIVQYHIENKRKRRTSENYGKEARFGKTNAKG